jgi:RHS repeat-associated protein
VHGQVRRDETRPPAKTLGYDPAGPLTSVVDAIAYGGPRVCTTRTYGYDAESNRTALRSYPDAGGQPDTGNCSTSTSPAVYASGYDQADRLTNTGYVYDLFGRTTTDPYPPSGSSVTVGYYVNDLVASETVGSTTRSYALDPARRVRSWTDGSTTSTNHYTSASGDSPAWIGVGTAWTRNIQAIGGDLAAVQTDTGTVTLQLTNLHGDVVATVDDSTSASSIASYAESNEFGVPYFTSSAYPRYGWLGGKQRSHDTLASIVLMGVRLYDPNTGRFLQTDPIPGGSANPYDYANQDPYNNFDLDGRWCAFGKNPNGSCRGSRQVSAVTSTGEGPRVGESLVLRSSEGPSALPPRWAFVAAWWQATLLLQESVPAVARPGTRLAADVARPAGTQVRPSRVPWKILAAFTPAGFPSGYWRAQGCGDPSVRSSAGPLRRRSIGGHSGAGSSCASTVEVSSLSRLAGDCRDLDSADRKRTAFTLDLGRPIRESCRGWDRGEGRQSRGSLLKR